MGSKHLGVDHNIVLALQKESGIDTFVESGMWKAGTTTWAAQHFDYVVSIEGMPDRYWKTWHNTIKGNAKIMPWTGDSAVILPRILNVMRTPAIFWLDAHYCTSNQQEASAGLQVCPVMHELLAINDHPCAHLHIIMVDDARLFGIEKGWPREDVLLAELKKHNRQCWQYDDVWYAFPKSFTPVLAPFMEATL